MSCMAGSGPIRPIRAQGDGFVVEGPGFYCWDQDLDTVVRIARELGSGSPELAQSARVRVREE